MFGSIIKKIIVSPKIYFPGILIFGLIFGAFSINVLWEHYNYWNSKGCLIDSFFPPNYLIKKAIVREEKSSEHFM